MDKRRIIVLILDSVGVGELPDAAEYGDEGSATLPNVAEAVGGLHLPNLEKLGLGNIVPITGVNPNKACKAAWGKMAEKVSRQGYNHRSLGDNGSYSRQALPGLSQWVSRGR